MENETMRMLSVLALITLASFLAGCNSGDTPPAGDPPPAAGEETPAAGEETPAAGEETPAANTTEESSETK